MTTRMTDDALVAALAFDSQCLVCGMPLVKGAWSMVDTGVREVPVDRSCLALIYRSIPGARDSVDRRTRAAAALDAVAEARSHMRSGLRERRTAAAESVRSSWLAGAGTVGGTALQRRALLAEAHVHPDRFA